MSIKQKDIDTLFPHVDGIDMTDSISRLTRQQALEPITAATPKVELETKAELKPVSYTRLTLPTKA